MDRYWAYLRLTERSGATVRGRTIVAAIVVLCACLGATSPAHAYNPVCTWGGGITLTYDFENGTNDIAGSGEQQMIAEATAVWGNVANVTLRRRTFAEPVYKWISWQIGDHGDGLSFTGTGEASHNISMCTNNNKIHFNDSYLWSTLTNSTQRNLYYHAMHESGHALGLGDSAAGTQSIMEPSVSTVWVGLPGLGWDDIAGVQNLYGRNRGVYHLRNSNTGGNPNKSFYWADLGDTPVAGDWNNDGTDTIGVYRPSTQYWYLRDTNESVNATYAFKWGSAGDRAVVGDWDGNGTDTIGVYRPSNGSFYLKNTASGGVANHIFSYGNNEDLPVAGDWNGDGVDTVGLYRPSTNTFFLSNQLGAPVNYQAQFGTGGDLPVVGDWNNDGTDTIGVYRPNLGSFELRNSNSGGASDYSLAYGRSLVSNAVVANGRPVSGDWNGDGVPTMGLYQN